MVIGEESFIRRFTIYCLNIRPPYYLQFQRVKDFCVIIFIIGKLGDWDHHNKEITNGSSDRVNKMGANLQFMGERCGMRSLPIRLFRCDITTLFGLTKTSYWVFFIAHLINLWVSVTSKTMGINEWFAPQISEHCP